MRTSCRDQLFQAENCAGCKDKLEIPVLYHFFLRQGQNCGRNYLSFKNLLYLKIFLDVKNLDGSPDIIMDLFFFSLYMNKHSLLPVLSARVVPASQTRGWEAGAAGGRWQWRRLRPTPGARQRWWPPGGSRRWRGKDVAPASPPSSSSITSLCLFLTARLRG